MPKEFRSYFEVQRKAKSVLSQMEGRISPDSTEASIADQCVALLKSLGVEKTWYYQVPAFVLLGSRSCLSISGKNYTPAQEPVGRTNLVTIDLSPLVDETWGDCARSYCVENGKVTAQPEDSELASGLETERALHRELRRIAQPGSSFQSIFQEMNAFIVQRGYVNLDFMGNLGHSIVKEKADRIYFEKGNTRRLEEVDCFTFEPHIQRQGGRWGFKHENIYFFDDTGTITEL